MKIIIANKFYYPRGGDCIHLIALKNLLEEHGHQVAVFAMQHPDNLANEYSAFWPSMLEYSSKKPGNLKEALLRPLFSKEVRIKWNKLLDAFQPDLVHLHNIHTQLSPAIAEEAWKRSIPVYWTLHDYKLICPSYTLLRDGKVCEDCLKDQKSVVKHRCIKGSLIGSIIGYLEALKWSHAKLLKYTNSFISPSLFLKDKMQEAGYPIENIKHLYNFTETDKFSAELSKGSYCVYLGRLSNEKGVETLLKVASKLPNCTLKIIGEGPLRDGLEKHYRAKNIEFMGYLQWEEIKQLLGKARFMVIPSEWYDNNPLSIIESLAVGTPVLGAQIGGIPELINASNGMLFKSGDVDDLSNKIGKMMTAINWDYQQISVAAKERFSAENYYKELMNIYCNH